MGLKVLMLENVHDEAAAAFEKEGFEVIRQVALTEEEEEAILPTINAICIRSKTKLPKEKLDKCVNLMVIGCFCIGTDTIDLKYAAGKGIPVFNSPYANTRSVAELCLAEMIMLARQAGDRTMEIHAGEWNKKSKGCYEIRGKTLGLVGYGHVGAQLSVLAEALGMKVIFHDIVKKLRIGNTVQADSLDEVLGACDFLSLHVPKLKSTENIIAAEQIAKMKKGSYLLNASRGNVVVIDDVAAALHSGHLAGCAFDVFPIEPKAYCGKGGFTNSLMGCPNTILTPHIGGSTEEAQEAIGVEVASKMIAFIERGSTMLAVNVPECESGSALEATEIRILSFHKNVPGVIRDINAAISVGNINFQSLRTQGDVGYLIVDLSAADLTTVKKNLEVLPNAIRTYALGQGPGYQGVAPGEKKTSTSKLHLI